MPRQFGLIIALLLSLCCGRLMAQPASPEDTLVQVLTLSVTNGDHVYSLPLQNAARYYARISGVYGYANWAPWMDAAYCYQGPVQGCNPALPDTGGLDADWFWNNQRNQRPTPDLYDPEHNYIFYFQAYDTIQDFFFYEPNSWDYVDNVGELNIQIYRDLPACQTTDIPFVDNFDSPELDSCWTWVREDKSHWSLTERPGWMRIITQSGSIYDGTDLNLLLRKPPVGSYQIETQVDIAPQCCYNAASAMIYNGVNDFLSLTRIASGTQQVLLQGVHDGILLVNTHVACSDTSLYLRMNVLDNLITGYWSPDSINWVVVGQVANAWASSPNSKIGLTAANDSPEIPADFDYFRIDSLSGTTVCGDVSGVWDSMGSPYYVICDVTVPDGQTLEIQPGVEVLFMGPYNFYVNGNLQAVGTETDSIIFTTETNVDTLRWRGIKFSGLTSSASHLSYCSIEKGLCLSPTPYEGAGIRCGESASPLIEHCSISSCRAVWGGGMNVTSNAAPAIKYCVFLENSAVAAGGGISFSNSGQAILENCTFIRNSGESWNSGAVMVYQSPVTIRNSVIAQSPDYGLSLQDAAGSIIEYCNIFDSDSGNIRFWNGSGDGPANLGVLNTVNISGDPCDQYQNIFLNPQFVNDLSDFHLQDGSPCIDAGDPSSLLDPDGTQSDMGAFYYFQEPLCAHTDTPYHDNFDSPELDSCWSWIREDPSHWSLTERPGYMRIRTQEGSWDFWHSSHNTMLRAHPIGNFVAETCVRFNPTHRYQTAGVTLYNGDLEHIDVARSFDGEVQSLYFCCGWGDEQPGDQCGSILNSDTVMYLRIERIDSTIRGFWSSDGLEWIYLGQLSDRVWLYENFRIGIFAINGTNTGGAPEIPADFDYFHVDSLPGTTICGDVFGIWDSTGSPYYVTCDVTVPAGQTLEIQPGVKVLFTGHYKFNVLGNLQAIGTEQDSIVFSRAFPTEESRWGGIRVADQASDATHLAYCRIEFGNATGTLNDSYGGGLFIDRCDMVVEDCQIRYNNSQRGGGVACIGPCQPHFTRCRIEFNSADTTGVGDGGAITHIPDGSNGGTISLDFCALHHNAATFGGAIWQQGGSFVLTNCTITENRAATLGGGVMLWRSSGFSVTSHNTILWGNSAPADPEISFGESFGTIVATYSNIRGDYIDTGNIDAEPMFVDPTNGDFHLQPGSPCINSGDPTSPLDPDGSRTDMGAFPYFNPPYCGEVSGVWTTRALPYKIACDVTIPDGDTLFIEPGVTVEFLGDYKMTVNGTLLAEGTDNDRIEFWTDTSTNPDRWSGVRFIKSDGSSLLENCVFRFGSSVAGDSSVLGGAVFVDSSVVRVEDCLFEYNQAQFGGAVNMFMPLAGSTLKNCVFRQNESVPSGATGYGGAVRVRALPMTIEDCLFEGNTGRVGAAVNATLTDVLVQNSTFVGNSATTGGHTGNVVQGSLDFVNCIFVGQDSVSAFDISTGNVDIEYSCVDGWAGPYSNIAEPVGFGDLNTINVNGDSVDANGNIFVDPLFGIDEFDLMWNSPAIDAGNPASSFDPDSSIADQGWKPYYQPSLLVAPDSLWFDTLVYGESQTLYLTLTNPSPVAAPVISLTWSDAAFNVDSLPNWIQPGDTIVMQVEFTPPMEGIYLDTLRILSKLSGPDLFEIPMNAYVPLVPSAVDSLVVKLGALNGTQLYWAPVTTTTSGQQFTPAFYVIWGSTEPEGPYTPFGVSATTSYQHPFIINSQAKYFYIVTASDGSAVTRFNQNHTEPNNAEK